MSLRILTLAFALLVSAPLARAQGARAGELERLLAHAEQFAPAMLEARARLAHADADDVEAAMLLPEDPVVQGQLGRRRSPEGRDFELQLMLQQRIEIAGERRLRRAVAGRSRERIEAELTATWAEVRWSIERLYELSRVARAQRDFAEGVARFQSRMAEVAERRRVLGEAGAREGHLARAELARGARALAAARGALEVLERELARTSGWRGPLVIEGEVATPRALTGLEPLVQAALADAPRLRARRAALAEADARVSLAAREAIPSPSLSFQVQREGNPSGGFAQWVMLGGVQVPIPVWRRGRPERARAEAARLVAEAEVAADLVQLEGELRSLARELETAASEVDAVAAELEPLDRGVALLERAFELGEIDLLEVALARERLHLVRAEHFGALARWASARARLEALLGRAVDDSREAGASAGGAR